MFGQVMLESVYVWRTCEVHVLSVVQVKQLPLCDDEPSATDAVAASRYAGRRVTFPNTKYAALLLSHLGDQVQLAKSTTLTRSVK